MMGHVPEDLSDSERALIAERIKLFTAVLAAPAHAAELALAAAQSEDRNDAAAAVQQILGCDAPSAEAVLDMQLHRLTRAEQGRWRAHIDDLRQRLGDAK
jgi:DNA gyrase/topoisomerase IV subunit A